MIPNVFLSSTISDLRYLRDGLRDAIDELSYHPIMSEHGEIGYLNPTTAAESCYRSVKQCHMVVLIVGCRYGSVDTDGISVTHREFRAAQEESLPTITFVESQVLNFKEVFHADPKAAIWDDFKGMDNPRKTFALLDEIDSSDTFNAIIPFSSVAHAKDMLKKQIADFVGDRLGNASGRINRDVRDVLAEVRTLRNMLAHQLGGEAQEVQRTKKYLAVTRYLLSDKCKTYRDFLEQIFGDLDKATEKIGECPDVESVLRAAEWSSDVTGSFDGSGIWKPDNAEGKTLRRYICSMGNGGGFELFSDNSVKLAEVTRDEFNILQSDIFTKTQLA